MTDCRFNEGVSAARNDQLGLLLSQAERLSTGCSLSAKSVTEVKVAERPWPDRRSRRCRSCSAHRSISSWKSTASAYNVRMSWSCSVRWCSSLCRTVCERCRCHRPSATMTMSRRRRQHRARDQSRSRNDECLRVQHTPTRLLNL